MDKQYYVHHNKSSILIKKNMLILQQFLIQRCYSDKLII